MTKKLFLAVCLLIVSLSVFSKEKQKKLTHEDSVALVEQLIKHQLDSVEQNINYKSGKISLNNGMFNVNVPKGFKFVEEKQAQYILEDMYGNPPDKSVLGLIFPEDRGVFTEKSYFFVVTYNDMGHVDDDDAEDTKYDELLVEMKKDFKAENPERVKQGYPPCELIGWASTPYYDKDKKVLHWAKEVKFGDDSTNTLNYDVRILGKAGVLVLQAVAGIEQLGKVKKNIDNIYNMVEFSEGNKYSNFNPSIDKVAAVGIGGLVAGKVLAKVGFFAVILKAWKFILIGLAAAGGAIMKLFKRKKKDDDTTSNIPPTLNS